MKAFCTGTVPRTELPQEEGGRSSGDKAPGGRGRRGRRNQTKRETGEDVAQKQPPRARENGKGQFGFGVSFALLLELFFSFGIRERLFFSIFVSFGILLCFLVRTLHFTGFYSVWVWFLLFGLFGEKGGVWVWHWVSGVLSFAFAFGWVGWVGWVFGWVFGFVL